VTYQVRTDLTVELARPLTPKKACGYSHTERSEKGIGIFSLSIHDRGGEKIFSRPIGDYITLSFDESTVSFLPDVAGPILTDLMKLSHTPMRLLLVGLGNAGITADAIGPETVARVSVTGHLGKEKHATELFAIAPSTSGNTGFESFTLIKAAVKASNATHVLAVDALAAESTERLYKTLQIATSGIVPGSGVGNHRHAISQKTLGIPVIAIGVPSVVSCATLVYRALEEAGFSSLSEAVINKLKEQEPFFVTPPDADRLTHTVSQAIADTVMTLIHTDTIHERRPS